jgi:tape measure domain-containing protein
VPGFEVGAIDVTVEPDFTGFRAKTAAQLREEEARLKNVKAKVEPELSTGFRRSLATQLREASAGVKMEIDAHPNLAAGFRRSLTEQVTRSASGVTMKIEAQPVLAAAFRRQLREAVEVATAGEGVKVEVSARLSEGFRKDLQAQLTRSTKGLAVHIDALPRLVKGFRKELEVQLKKTKANTFFVYAEPRLAPGFRSKLRKLATDKSARFPVTVDIVAEAPRDIKRKLYEAVRLATSNPPLVARVKIDPDFTDLRKKTQLAIASVKRGMPKLTPTIDANTLRRRLLSDVNSVMAAANRLAKLNVVATIRTVGRKGLDAATRSMQLLGRTARNVAIGLGVIGAAIGAAGAAGLKSAADFEFTRKNFGILLDDAAKGESVFRGLTKAAQESIYELPDLQPLVQNLLVVSRLLPGALKFDDVIPAFQTITDLGATLDLTGPALTRVGLALAKIAGRGKLTGEELRSISKNAPGLNAIQLIADDLGVTVPEAFDKIRAGAVSSDEAIRILLDGIKNFKGAAGAGLEEVSTTFKGAMSNLPDILRLSFFNAFEDQLPEITKIIAPGGPLVTAFEQAAPALGRAFVPVANAFFTSLSDFAPAITSLVESVTPVFSQLARASEAVGLQVRRAFDNMGPGLRDAAESFAGLLAGLSPVLPLIGEFVSLLGTQFSRVIDGLIGSGAVDLVVGFFESLSSVLDTLIPILAQVAETVGGALLEAFADIDLVELGDSFGILATAVGDLLVALAPLIPELVEIAAIFARSLAPAIEASIPLLEAFITVAAPIAETLARMGPSIIILVALGKAALALGRGVATLTQFRLSLENLRKTAEGGAGGQAATAGGKGGILGRMLNIDAGQIERALKRVVGAAAAAAAGMSAYFAAASTDMATQIGGVVTTVGSIATAFAIGGPIAGGIAAVAAGIGAIFGQMAKNAAKAREEARAIEELGTGFAQSFKVTGTDTPEKRIIGIVDNFSKLLDVTNDTEGGKGAKEFFGRFNADLTEASVLLGKSRKDFDEYANTIIRSKADQALEGNVSVVRDFSVEMGKAAHAAQYDLEPALLRQVNVTDSLGQRGQFLNDVFDDFANNGDINAVARQLRNAGASGDVIARTMQTLRTRTREAFREALGAKFGIQLDDSVLKGIEQAEQMRKVQELLKTDTQKLADGFNGFQGAVTEATDALRAYQDLQAGDAVNRDQVLLNTIDAAKQLYDIRKQQFEGAISTAEAEARAGALIRETAGQNAAAIGSIMVQSAGDYDAFKRRADVLRETTIKGLRDGFIAAGDSVGVASQKANALVDEIIKIPDEHEFNLRSNTPEMLEAIKKFRSQLKLLNDAKLKDITLRVRADVSDLKGKGIDSQKFVQFSAAGRLVRKPMLSFVGEEGPELILPLTDPARMAQLVKEAQAAGLLGAGGIGGGPTGAPAPLGLQSGVDPRGGKEFTREAGEAIADLGDQLVASTNPGLDKWQGTVGQHLDSVKTRLDQFGVQAKASMSQTIGGLTGIATVGTAGVVGALRTGLNSGTTTVSTIVKGYAKSLASALNPVLEAIGQPKITNFRKGGVNDPRIVPDGAYDVHVFGERGTHGEAYIPFDPNLKSRSRAIADETVRRLGGKASWFRGGGITGDSKGMDPEFLRRLDRWSQRVGSPYNIDSGYRSFEAQRRLYQRYLAGVPGQAPAAPPGRSMHNFGLASDGSRWSGRGPGDFGLRFPMSYEPWHVEPNEAREWALQPDRRISIVPLPKPPSAGAFGQLSITGKKAMQFTYMQALAWAGKQALMDAPGTLGFSGSGSASEAAAAQWARQAMGLTGVGGHWLPGLMTLMQRESGFDPRAINLWDSNARKGTPSMGIAQMIMSTFLAHALPGMTSIYNPVHNLASAIRYILEEYGDISAVQQARSGAVPRGYENGAIVDRQHVAMVAERNRAEVIIPLTRPQRARQLAHQSGLAAMLATEGGGQGYQGPNTVVENVNVSVVAPDAREPEAYAASMGNRMTPAIRAAMEAAVGA